MSLIARKFAREQEKRLHSEIKKRRETVQYFLLELLLNNSFFSPIFIFSIYLLNSVNVIYKQRKQKKN